jgi:hypothetical protein
MTGAYISHDGGHHWRMFNLRGSIRFFAFDPVLPHTLYAANDLLWRSVDDGVTWSVVWPSPSAIRAIHMDSDHADESVVATPNPIGHIVALAIDPTNSRMLYAAATKQSQTMLVFSRDGGIRWTRLRTLTEEPLHIWIDPASSAAARDLYVAAPHTVYVRRHGSWQSRVPPAGQTFTDISAGFASCTASRSLDQGYFPSTEGSIGESLNFQAKVRDFAPSLPVFVIQTLPTLLTRTFSLMGRHFRVSLEPRTPAEPGLWCGVPQPTSNHRMSMTPGSHQT